jgi:hypothetical protein
MRVLFLLLLVTCANASAAEFEGGYQLASGFNADHLTRKRPYLAGKHSFTYEKNDSVFSLNLAARAWYDFDSEFQVRALSASWAYKIWKTELGFQEIPWGETFGDQIADIVNPRDLRDPLFNEPNWTRLPVFALNQQVFIGKLTLQLIFVPVPRNNFLPKKGSEFDVVSSLSPALQVSDAASFSLSNAPRDSEYGGKANYLFASGIDLGVFYYGHWNRDPQYAIIPVLGAMKIAPLQRKIDSFGLTLSQDVGHGLVLRGDSVLHKGLPTVTPQMLVSSDYRNQWLTIVGADWTSEDSLTLGGQLHSDINSGSDLYGISAQVIRPMFSSKIEPAAFVYSGVNHSDLWIQPKLTWNAAANWSVSLRADLLWHNGLTTPGYLDALNEKKRVFAWVLYRL